MTTWERIQEENDLTFGFAGEIPYAYAEGDDVTGTDPEVLKDVMGGYGVTNVNGELVDFAGLIPGLLAGRFDAVAAGVGITAERCEEVAFSRPIAQVTSPLAVRAGNPKDLHSLEDIAADPTVKVGTVTGGLHIPWLEAAGVATDQILTFPDSATSFTALDGGRLDAVIVFTPATLEALEIYPDLELAEPFETPTTPEGNPGIVFWAFVLRQEDQDLKEAINDGMAELHSSGRQLEILSEFGHDQSSLPDGALTGDDICAGDY
jgi:polar amino acid transport system substrate-binding protein